MKNNIKVQRAILNITQEELAKRIGVSRQTVNALEAGKYVPSTVLALKISKYFKMNVEEIFQLEDNDWNFLFNRVAGSERRRRNPDFLINNAIWLYPKYKILEIIINSFRFLRNDKHYTLFYQKKSVQSAQSARDF